MSFGAGYALSWSEGSSCWVGWGVPRAGRALSRGRMRLVLGECCRAQGTGVFFWVTGR